MSLSPFAPENLVSRDGFGSPVPRQPAHLHTQAESGAYLGNFSQFPRQHPFFHLNRHTSSYQSQVYRVTQLRTDGVHCRESAGTGPPVNLKVVSVTGAAFASPWTNYFAPLFPTLTIYIEWAACWKYQRCVYSRLVSIYYRMLLVHIPSPWMDTCKQGTYLSGSTFPLCSEFAFK